MLCQHCKRQPAYWACPLKASETGQYVALCDACYRAARTIDVTVRQGKPLAEYVEPPRWGVP